MAKSKDQLLAKIDNLFVEINSQYADLKNNGQLVDLDIALLASNIDYLSANVKTLHYFQAKVESKKECAQDQSFTPGINLSKEADEQEVFEEIQEQAFFKEEKSVLPTPVMEEPKVVIPEVSFVNEVIEEAKPIVIEETEVSSAMLEEEVATEPTRPLTINELIHQQKKAGVNMTQQFQTSAATSSDKILDLKSAISLNDKLLFIKDLFNGYSLAYSEAIELLNRFDNYAEADAFLQSNYALKNGWSDKSQTVDKFYSLIRKKFN